MRPVLQLQAARYGHFMVLAGFPLSAYRNRELVAALA
jgi:hypothetical protein